jgi:hypothetical protein
VLALTQAIFAQALAAIEIEIERALRELSLGREAVCEEC